MAAALELGRGGVKADGGIEQDEIGAFDIALAEAQVGAVVGEMASDGLGGDEVEAVFAILGNGADRGVAQIFLKAHAIAPEAVIEQAGAEIKCKGAKHKGSKEQRHRTFVIPGLGLCAIGGQSRR